MGRRKHETCKSVFVRLANHNRRSAHIHNVRWSQPGRKPRRLIYREFHDDGIAKDGISRRNDSRRSFSLLDKRGMDHQDHHIVEIETSRQNEPRRSYSNESDVCHARGRRDQNELGGLCRRDDRTSGAYGHCSAESRNRSRSELTARHGRHINMSNAHSQSRKTPRDKSVRSDGYHDETRPLEYMDLKELVDEKTPQDIIRILVKEGSGLEQLLRRGRTLLDDGMAEMMLQVFGKMLDGQIASSTLDRVLSLIDEHNFEIVICDFLRDLQIDPLNERRAMTSFHVGNALKIARAFMITRPARSKRKIYDMTCGLRILIENFGLAAKFRHLLHEIEEMIRRAKKAASPDDVGPIKKRRAERDDMSEPTPQLEVDFRKIPVFPQLQDLQRGRPFLRPNVTDRAYEGLHHYLDVQYRLLREDYIQPLRDGIEELRRSAFGAHATNGQQNVKVYRDVRIVSTASDRKGDYEILHRLQFSTTGLENERWQNNKRLMFGNLLCISSDMFQHEVLFAVVTNRKPEDLQDGHLTVAFVFEENKEVPKRDSGDLKEDDVPGPSRPAPPEGVFSIDLKKVYIAVESEAYFETYRHVLAGLKDTHSLPLERYIVSCAKDIRSPLYLRPETGQRLGYNFSSITGEDKSIDPLGQEWPTHDELGLNESQAAALKLALTNELSIIQGPPGTGKTHVGIAIMNLLLRNKKVWSRIGNVEESVSHFPILVVCYTNHALDQFLMEIVKFTQKIVRIGGRCQNDALQQFTLREIEDTEKAKMTGREMEMLKIQMQRLARDILPKNTAILESHCGVRMLDDRHVSPRLLQQFTRSESLRELTSEELQHWLGFREKKIKDYPFYEWVIGDDLNRLVRRIRRHGGAHNKEASNRFDVFDEDKMKGRKGQSSRYVTGKNEQNITHGRSEYSMKKCELAIRQLLGETSLMTKEEEDSVVDVDDLTLGDRWRLYRTWVNRWRGETLEKLYGTIMEYSRLAKEAREIERRVHVAILKKADVVAATTTGAAKYRNLIYKLDSKIVVVEEAAEVMEAHIITAMPESTQHLILIGDHQQLKPSATVHELAKRYHLDTSLFERMIKAKIPHVTLNVQHRMRPEIADLLRPRIYSDLKDHESVNHRGRVTGITKPMFFISHDIAEQRLKDVKSRQNAHEVDFLVALCDYLLKQGYHSKQITILTMYSGQLFAFRNAMTENMEEVHVTSVDNFQGEENDIILLSLVRSNEEAKIGFLAVENRVCVALSRAKKALYCIGNMELLAKTNRLWKDIKMHLEKAGCIGESLMLQCVNHPGCRTEVRAKFDFNMVPEGGCGQPCRTRLDCGHVCPRACHPDNDHSYVRCQKQCEKMLECGHKCTKICANLCDPCNEVCGETLDCGHGCLRKCYESCHPCVHEVIKKLNCGHEQLVLCEERLEEVKCHTKIEVELRCGHQTKIYCMLSGTVDRMKCREKCTDSLDCQHKCKGSCGECYQGRLHIPCAEPCGRVLVCGHECESKCSSCPPCEKECETRCVHSSCEKPCEEPCVPCKEKCSWKCRHKKCNKLCSEPCDRDPCNEACDEVLDCGHPCIGLCGEPCPELCKICDEAEVTEIFFGDEDEENARFVELEDCGHVFTYAALDTWMNQKGEGGAVKMKACPRCSTTIWRSMRYGNVVNKLLQSINKVKTMKLGELAEMGEQKARLLQEVQSLLLSSYDSMTTIIRLKYKLQDLNNVGELYITEKMFRRLLAVLELERAEAKLSTGSLIPQDYKSAFRCDIEAIRKWVLLKRYQIPEKEDERFSDEIERLQRVLEYFDIHYKSECQMTIDSKVTEMIEELGKLLLETTTPYNDNFTVKRDVDGLFERIHKLAPFLKSGFGISAEDKKMICSAMGFRRKGHWFECPNGHVYAIGDCGGAVVKSKCPECNEDIGGTSHQLDQTNRVSEQMDGSTRSAYEEDMRTNYIPGAMLADLHRQGFR